MRYPLLLLLMGFAQYATPASRPKASRSLMLASQASRCRLPHASVAERILIHTGESAALRLRGQPKGAISAARAAMRLLNTADDEQLVDVGRVPLLYAHLGWTLYGEGKTDEALVVFLRGVAEAGEGSADGRGSLAMLCVMQAQEGDLAAAAQNVRLARAPSWGTLERSIAPSVHLGLADALIALERLDAQAAGQHLVAARYDRETTQDWLEIVRVEALVALVAGRPAEGLAAMDEFARSRGAEGRSAYALQRLAPVRALLELGLGNVEAADLLLREGDAPTTQLRIDRARIDLARGRLYAALHSLRSLVLDGLSPRALAEATAIEAAVLLRLPGALRSSGAVDRLGALLRRTGLRLPLALLPRADFDRVAAMLDRRGYTDLCTEAEAVLPSLEGLALTPREVALLKVLSQPGVSRTSAAAQLHVSVNTVKTQLRLLYRKLGVSDRESALAAALNGRLLQEEDEPSLPGDPT